MNTNLRWLNSEEGLAQCEREEAEAEIEAARKQARAEEKQAEDDERQRQRQRRDPAEPFIGAINSRKKAELQDITYTLGLDIRGRVEDLKSKINAYFNTHEELCTSSRYIGLFPQLARQARQTAISSAAVTTAAPSQPLCDVVNTVILPSTCPYNLSFESTQFTFSTNIQQPDTQQNNSPYLSSSLNSPLRHPGPLNQLSSSVCPGYIAHIPSYYNVNTYTLPQQ